MEMNISKHITFEEATHTGTGIDNAPDIAQVKSMMAIAEMVFEPLREKFGKPIPITSFFRSEAVNKAVGGAKTSQHTKGEAMDLNRPGFNAIIFDIIRNNLPFDQLIWEFGNSREPQWVHVSYKHDLPNRGQVLKSVKSNGKTTYVPYYETKS